MRKFLLILICVAAASALLSHVRGQSLGERIKKAACEKVCERNYNNCMTTDEKAENEDGYATDVQDAAKEETCATAREKCMEKCDEI